MLNDFLDFSINLIDDNDEAIAFNPAEKKYSILNFKIEVFETNRKLRPTKSVQQLKDEQRCVMLEKIEKYIESFKLEKDKQLYNLKHIAGCLN